MASWLALLNPDQATRDIVFLDKTHTNYSTTEYMKFYGDI